MTYETRIADILQTLEQPSATTKSDLVSKSLNELDKAMGDPSNGQEWDEYYQAVHDIIQRVYGFSKR